MVRLSPRAATRPRPDEQERRVQDDLVAPLRFVHPGRAAVFLPQNVPGESQRRGIPGQVAERHAGGHPIAIVQGGPHFGSWTFVTDVSPIVVLRVRLEEVVRCQSDGVELKGHAINGVKDVRDARNFVWSLNLPGKKYCPKACSPDAMAMSNFRHQTVEDIFDKQNYLVGLAPISSSSLALFQVVSKLYEKDVRHR